MTNYHWDAVKTKYIEGIVPSTYDNESQYEIENSVLNIDIDTELFSNDETSFTQSTDLGKGILIEEIPHTVSNLNE